MQTRSSLQRRTNSEHSDRVVVHIKPRSWGDETHEQPQTVQPQNTGFDFKNADWFSHDPGPRSPVRVFNTIQAKLTVGAPNDMYEQEADRVAEQVMTMPEPAQVQREIAPEEEKDTLHTKPLATTITPLVQRDAVPGQEDEEENLAQTKLIQRDAVSEQEDEEENLAQTKLIQRDAVPGQEDEDEPLAQAKLIQREVLPGQEDEDEPLAQTKPSQQTSPDAGFQAESNLENRLTNSQGGGSPLPEEVRSFMEPRIGADFSQVRVHTGNEAVQMNQDLNAQAFTHKQDVYFGAGKSPAKDALTAHELTHVVQQTGEARGGSVQQQRLPLPASKNIGKPSASNTVRRKSETLPLPNWGSSIINNASNMNLNPVAKLTLDGKPAGDNWDISADKPAVFKAPKCTKNGEIQIVVHGTWFQNNVFGNESGEGQVTVSTAFDVNEKGELHFKAATESHTIKGSAAQMTGAGAASDNPPNGGSLVTQVAINSTDSKAVGPSGGFTVGGKFTPGGVGVDGSGTAGLSKTVTTPSSNSFSRGYRADLMLEKRETKSMALTQPVYFRVGKHKIIGSRDKGQPANIKDIYTFLQKLPSDVRKELEDGKGDGKAQIQVLAKASVTTPSHADAGFNLELSEKRRDAVVRILQNFLGGGAKIKAKAVGELEAIEPGEADMERMADITVTWEDDPCKTDSLKP